MGTLRPYLIAHRWLALALVTLALMLKAAVPGGYMVRQEGAVLTIAICGDASGAHLTQQIVVPQREIPGDASADHVKHAVCPFSALGLAGAIAADPFLLAEALAHRAAIAWVPRTAPAVTAAPRLRPPLRGPPSVS